MAKITDEVLAAMKAAAPLNQAKCEAIALQFDLKARSLIASASRNGIKYERKARVSKSGDPVVTKEDLVKAIARDLDVTVESLSGLDKATKTALVVVAAGLAKDEIDVEVELEVEA